MHRARPLLLLLVLSLVGSACSSGDDDAAASAVVSTTTTVAPVSIDRGLGPTPADAADALDMLLAFIIATYDRDGGFDDEDAPDWYVGYESRGSEHLQVSTVAATIEEGTQQCKELAPIAAWFWGDITYELAVAGYVHLDDGTFDPADWDPLPCRRAPPVGDPVLATAPPEEVVTSRALDFVSEYLEEFAEVPWFTGNGGGSSSGSGPWTIEYEVEGEHCDDLRLLFDWLMRDAAGAPVAYELELNEEPCPAAD